jgi:hypothetical protein
VEGIDDNLNEMIMKCAGENEVCVSYVECVIVISVCFISVDRALPQSMVRYSGSSD